MPMLPPPAVPAPIGRRPMGRWLRVVLVVVASALVAGLAQATGSALHDTSLAHPDEWDRRVLPLVEYVESARGHDFDHPVPVYFLSAAEYRRAAQNGGEVGEPSAEDRRDSRRDAAELRAVGMLQGDPDLLDAGDELADAGTLAFYDQDLDVVNVRGSELTVGRRVTLVHELTHALQDQEFDVVHLLSTDDSERGTAVRAVIEGDATAVEHQYVSELPEDEQEEYFSESEGSREEAEADLEDVPDVLTTLFGLPYALGSSFVDLVDADATDPRLDRIDDVFARMPANTSQLFNPQDYFDRVRKVQVRAPRLGSGDRHARDSLGAGFLFVMLSERIDAATAMTAVDGWRGDQYRSVVLDEVDELCLTARIRTASSDDGAELRVALSAWAAAMPTGADATTGGDGADATFRTCDPGPEADIGVTGRSTDALAYPVVRNQLAAGQVSAGLSRDGALCVASRVVPELTLGDLQAEELTEELQSKITKLVLDAMPDC